MKSKLTKIKFERFESDGEKTLAYVMVCNKLVSVPVEQTIGKIMYQIEHDIDFGDTIEHWQDTKQFPESMLNYDEIYPQDFTAKLFNKIRDEVHWIQEW